mmetsp:Transcript_20621/g.29600  ORF Transcript_20621/g.29600 Transcript_20621/m.29600 type:complete len:674 (+) Transcript_20621:91-2112(+)|eukprot:CAMPEP_0185026340 /NCGR_PEP_ID=MMETSP1103-20130426/10340_1 /TAXON_ID=36769 /ORGANISM="Paraphysomonas bandaiensis, Strain Caron Lab Isolate" /LENGTH=673 /DNA_ID=CAMNT_0027559887 /DNA_START=24 /DNA_END=2048 /DNA_ORIENTATION=-
MDNADGKVNSSETPDKKYDASETKTDNKSDSKRVDELKSEGKQGQNSSDSKRIDDDINSLFEKGDGSENDTLSRNHPLAEFLKENKGMLKGLSQEEFKAKYSAYMKDLEDKNSAPAKPEHRRSDSADINRGIASVLAEDESKDFLDKIVLKFTTMSEANSEAPSFTVGTKGAKIGRDQSNEVCVPSDTRLAHEGHSFIEHSDGSFYLLDGGYDFSASIRISVGVKKKEWIMMPKARFSAGNSVFESNGLTPEGNLMLEVIEGPLKGERRVVTKKGASLGRSSDNIIAIPDRELSRRHSRVEWDEKLGEYCVCDIGSTNGTYMQLVGPYAGRYKLCINDHILVGRTGFSINRFDYGLSEEIGHRQTMEDSCTIVQHMDLPGLNIQNLAPQSFFGVFDGHGGSNASLYLSQNLHTNVGEALLSRSEELRSLMTDIDAGDNDDTHPLKERLDRIVIDALETSFLKTDHEFVTTSEHAQNGSTATTALVLGKRLYCANVGDSRSMLCRRFAPKPMSEDHKPTREDEQKRIRDAGGFVINNRVMGELAVSRAFGDAEFKKGIQSIIDEEGVKMSTTGSTGSGDDGEGKDTKNWDQPLIIAKPDVETTTLTDDDQFLLLACDGLFDVFTEQEVVDFVKHNMEEHGDAQKCCENITDVAINKRNSRDNVSVILIILNKWY